MTGGGSHTFSTAGHIGNAPGGFNPGGCGLRGVLDEVRMAAAVRSAAWIATEYANQAAPQTFYAVSAE